MRSLHSLTVCVLCCALTSADVQGQLQRGDIDRLVNPYIENEVVTGLVIGVLQGGHRQSFGYGRMGSDDARTPDGRTVYEIGSMTKVFTGILLAHAVVSDELALDTPVQSLLPDGILLKTQEAPILLRQLSTHSSGLPRLPDNLDSADPSNPYADYSVDQLYAFLSAYEPVRAPDAAAEYSNLGAGLLGHVLARHAGTSYEELLRQRITGPLDMTDTSIELNASMQERLAPPLLPGGTLTSNWDLPTLAGAGAIRSTVDDMLTFLAAQLEPPDGVLGEAIELAWEVHRQPKAPNEFAMGLGWHVARDQQTRWHNGATGGYHSMMLASRTQNAAVVLLCNTATGEVDRLAEDLIQLLAGMEVEPRSFEKPQEITVAPELLQRYAGRYAIVPEFVLTVSCENGRLYVQATGQPKFEIFAKSETEFFWKVVDAQLTFQMDDKGAVASATLRQNGRDMPAKRLPD